MSFETFDCDAVLREFGDAETARELATIVCTDVAEYAAALDRAAAGGDLTRLREVAHALKGAAGTVAAGPVCELASSIENGLRRGDPTAAQFAPALVAACQRLVVDLGTWLATLATPVPTAH